jgi:hypothetical protein
LGKNKLTTAVLLAMGGTLTGVASARPGPDQSLNLPLPGSVEFEAAAGAGDPVLQTVQKEKKKAAKKKTKKKAAKKKTKKTKKKAPT